MVTPISVVEDAFFIQPHIQRYGGHASQLSVDNALPGVLRCALCKFFYKEVRLVIPGPSRAVFSSVKTTQAIDMATRDSFVERAGNNTACEQEIKLL